MSDADGAPSVVALRQRVEELRAQARGLMAELPGVLRSKENSSSSFCHSVLPVLMHDSTTEIAERLRSAHGTSPHKSNGCADGMLDLRQYKTWGDACGSIDEALKKSVQDYQSAARTGDPTAQLSEIDGSVGAAKAQWTGMEYAAWRAFGDGEVCAAADSTSLRLATCRKCQRVVSQQRFAAHWEHCRDFDYSRVMDNSPTQLAAAAKAKQGSTLVPTKFVAQSKKRKGDDPGEQMGMIEIEVITCDGCGLSPIFHHRYSCNQCVDFDLCEECYKKDPAKFLGHDATHDFCLLAIPVVNKTPIDPSGDAYLGKDNKHKKSGPIDLDRICGVALETGSGGRCMRTIDCKAHTQQAKRQVLGRSRPYDELLAERKAMKASQQQAALHAQGGGPPMALRPTKMRWDENEADLLASPGKLGANPSGLPANKRRKTESGASDGGLLCFVGVWDGNGAPISGRLPLMQHMHLRQMHLRCRGDGVDGGSVLGAPRVEWLGGSGYANLGGGCPLAVADTPRRENSVFSFMSRKQSSEIFLPSPPDLPFVGLHSKHSVVLLGDEARKGSARKRVGVTSAEEGSGAEGGDGTGGLGERPVGEKAAPKKKSKVKGAAALGIDGQAGAAPAAKGKSKGKAAANGRGVGGVAGQMTGGVGGVAGQTVHGGVGAQQRLGYGPKMGVAGAKGCASAPAKNAGRGGTPISPSGAMNMQNSGHSMSTGVARGGPHGGAPPGAMQGAVPGQGPPIRVRQAFKWAYNLRKKSIDKSRILAPQYTVMLPSGLDVHTAMVVLDPQKGPRLGTEHDQSPCKPEAHQVQQHPDLLEVIFKRRSTSQQATVFVDSVCTKCLQCFFVTDGGPTRPPQQQPAGAPGAQGPQAGKPGSYGAISGGLHHNYAQAPGWAQQQRAPASMHAAQHAQQQTGARHPALSQQQAVASSPAQQQAASRQPQQQHAGTAQQPRPATSSAPAGYGLSPVTTHAPTAGGSAQPKAYAAAATPQQRQQPMPQKLPTEHSQASVDAARSSMQHGGAQQGGAQQPKPANPEHQMAHQQIAAHSPSMPQAQSAGQPRQHQQPQHQPTPTTQQAQEHSVATTAQTSAPMQQPLARPATAATTPGTAPRAQEQPPPAATQTVQQLASPAAPHSAPAQTAPAPQQQQQQQQQLAQPAPVQQQQQVPPAQSTPEQQPPVHQATS